MISRLFSTAYLFSQSVQGVKIDQHLSSAAIPDRVNLIVLNDAYEEVDDEAAGYFLAMRADLPPGTHISFFCVGGSAPSATRVARLQSMIPADSKNPYSISRIEDFVTGADWVGSQQNIVLQIAPLDVPEQAEAVATLAHPYHHVLLGALGSTLNSKGPALAPAQLLIAHSIDSVVIDSVKIPTFTVEAAGMFGEPLGSVIRDYGFYASHGIQNPNGFIIHLTGAPMAGATRNSGGAKYLSTKGVYDSYHGAGAFEGINIDEVVTWSPIESMEIPNAAMAAFFAEDPERSFREVSAKYISLSLPSYIGDFAESRRVNLEQSFASQRDGLARVLAAMHSFFGKPVMYLSPGAGVPPAAMDLADPVIAPAYAHFVEALQDVPAAESAPLTPAYDWAAAVWTVRLARPSGSCACAAPNAA